MTKGEKIKSLRMALCLEQHEFGDLIGVSWASVSHYERGTRSPRLPTIRKMVELAKENKINLTVDDFIK